MKPGKILLIAAILVFAFLMVLNAASNAEDCPPGAPSCRVVVMTPDEVQTLTGSGLIFDSAVWANRATLSALIDQWKQKIANSPAGSVKPAPAKPEAKEPPKK